MTIPTQRDIRVTIISRIWAYATMMFLISILLSGQRQDRKVFLLPATIVFGAAISTIIVLRKLRDYRHDALFPSETLEELKQRIENLEAIAASDARHLDHSLKQLEQTALDRSWGKSSEDTFCGCVAKIFQGQAILLNSCFLLGNSKNLRHEFY